MLFGKLFFQQLLQFFLAGQNRFVLAGEDLGVVLWQGHFDDGVVFVLAEDNADGGVFFWQLDLAVVVVDVHLHLSNVLVLQFADFQVKEDEAAQEPVVKHQVYDEMLFVKREADLAAHERKAGTEFQQELLKMVDDTAFQLTLGVFRELGQAEKFQDVGVFDGAFRIFDLLAFGGKLIDFFFVHAEGQAFIEGAAVLPF